MADPEDLLDYEDEEQTETAVAETPADGPTKEKVKGTYVSIHSSGFRDFLLKPEILRAIVDCGFEHPSEGKHGQAIMLGITTCSNAFRQSWLCQLFVEL